MKNKPDDFRFIPIFVILGSFMVGAVPIIVAVSTPEVALWGRVVLFTLGLACLVMGSLFIAAWSWKRG